MEDLEYELLKADTEAAWKKYADSCRMGASPEERRNLFGKYSDFVGQQVKFNMRKGGKSDSV